MQKWLELTLLVRFGMKDPARELDKKLDEGNVVTEQATPMQTLGRMRH